MVEQYTISEIFEETKERFQAQGIEQAESNALWIFQESLKLHNQLHIYLGKDKYLEPHQIDEIKKHTEERIQGTPLQYIFGYTDFFGLRLSVNAHVLIPRPETEVLVEHIMNKLNKQKKTHKILDIGTGCGNIAVALAKTLNCHITAVDLTDQILYTAMQNAKTHQVLSKISFKRSNLFENINTAEQFDLIVSNPPYIAEDDVQDLPKEIRDFEPHSALSGGQNGLIIIEKIVNDAYQYLCEHGQIYLEIGGSHQSQQVINIFEQTNHYKNIKIYKDLSDKDRIIEATKNATKI